MLRSTSQSTKRGDTTHKARAKQARDFTGLRYGKITPTDIDGAIEYHDKCYVFYEAKHVNSPPFERGQELAFERLCDDLGKVKPVIFIVCKHSFPVSTPIKFDACNVEKYRYKGKWLKTKRNVRELTDAFIERVDTASKK